MHLLQRHVVNTIMEVCIHNVVVDIALHKTVFVRMGFI